MARKAMSKIETAATKAAETTVETTTMVPATKPTRKAAPKKAEPERVLDFSPMGKVSEWRASRQRMAIAQAAKQARTIDRLKLEYLYYVASAFFAGITFGVMIASWLR
ncbi:MAG: hypothetical protein J6S50_05615 [Oscillospiraceae bacterium]|nr:hypothetical protein [Lachnospiraceae bacterium]MBO7727973.1 hypothetical protein [Oscillospiraceae bacterium]